MNPEENNPLNPTALPGLGDQNNLMSPSGQELSMADSIASAEDNLTSAGLAATNNSGIMGLDQIGQPEAIMSSPIDEPLVPAAPVPGSIGSAMSVPPAGPEMPAPMDNPEPLNPFAAPEPVPAPGLSGGPMPAPAPGLSGGPMPAPEVAPQMPYNPFAQNLGPAEPAKPEGPALPPVGAAPTTPAPLETKPKFDLPKPQSVKPHGKSLTIILGVFAALMTILAIVFLVLWIQEKNKEPKIIPIVSPNDTSSGKIEMLTCSKTYDFAAYIDGYYNPNGTQSVNATYSDGKMSSLAVDYSSSLNSEEDAAYMKGRFDALEAEVLSSISGSFATNYDIEGKNFAVNIQSNDNNFSDVAARTLIYGIGSEARSLNLNDVRSHYETNGFACTTE